MEKVDSREPFTVKTLIEVLNKYPADTIIKIVSGSGNPKIAMEVSYYPTFAAILITS